MYLASIFLLFYPRWSVDAEGNKRCINLSLCRVNPHRAWWEVDRPKRREWQRGCEAIGRGGQKMERGQGRRGGVKRRRKSGVKGWVGEGGQRQKWQGEAAAGWSGATLCPSFLLTLFSHCFSSFSSITRHPDRASNWTWTSLSLFPFFLFLRLCLSLARSPPWLCFSAGALGPGNSWWQDSGCLSFCSRLPHPSLTAEERGI